MRVSRGFSLCGGILLLSVSLFGATDSTGHYSRWPKVRLGGISVGAGFSNVGGFPGFGYSPYFYQPWAFGDLFWGYPPPAYFYPYGLGELKLKDLTKTASVFVDGGFAGSASQLKDLWIEPGTHNLRVIDGNRSFEERIYVLTGKTLNLSPALQTEGPKQ